MGADPDDALVVRAGSAPGHRCRKPGDEVAADLAHLSAFIFINAEMWQVANDFTLPLFGMVMLLLVGIGGIFIFVSVRRLTVDLARFSAWGDVRPRCANTPVEEIIPADDEPAPDTPPLVRRAEWNVNLLLFVAQGIQVLLVSLVITTFYVVFGLLTVREETLLQWTTVGELTYERDWAVDIAIFGTDLIFTRQLLLVALFIGMFSGLNFAVQVITDDTYREEFIADMTAEVRDALAVRAVYHRRLVQRPERGGSQAPCGANICSPSVPGWVSAIPTSRGVNSNAACPAAPTTDALSIRLPATAVTARPGRANGRPTSPPTPVAAPGECPTPNCTATRTSRSSTGRHTPRSWPKRPPGSVWRPSPSPTTTASTAWCGSPRRPERSICPRSSEPNSPWPSRVVRSSVPVRPTLPGVTSSSSPAIPAATPCSVARSAKANWQGRRGAPDPLRTPCRTRRAGHGDHWAVLTACRKARCRLRS